MPGPWRMRVVLLYCRVNERQMMNTRFQIINLSLRGRREILSDLSGCKKWRRWSKKTGGKSGKRMNNTQDEKEGRGSVADSH